MKVRVPTSWEDVTLRQFIELSKVPDMGFSKEDANLRILSILTGIDDSELYELPVGELAKINALVKFIESKDSLFPVKYKIKIKDKRYKFEWKTNLLTSGEYIDIQEYLKKKGEAVDENTVKLLTGDDLVAGKAIFEKSCVTCHKATGGGDVGPNLTDDYWLHGGNIADLFKTIWMRLI